MQEKYNVTGMTFAACQARVQKSVSNLTGVQECNVNLLKNSIDDVTAMIAGQIGQLLPMDEETIKQFQTTCKKDDGNKRRNQMMIRKYLPPFVMWLVLK